MTGLQLQAKVAKALAKVNATSRQVSLRTVTTTGGNAVLGVGQTVTNLDTVMDPQPAVEQIKVDDVASSGGLLQFGDYRITLSGTYDEATLRNCELLYGTDVLKIIDLNPAVYGGVVAAWQVVARAVKAT